MSRALLLRHGESASNAHTGAEALSDEEGDRLTELGLEQARAAGEGLVGHGVTRLLTSPMRRATETADAVGAALDLEPEILPYAQELSAAETFEQVVARVRTLKDELEQAPDELPLVVSHGIFIRFFLLDSVLGAEFAPPMAGRIWQLASLNCGLSVFARGEYSDPTRRRGAGLDLPRLDAAAVGTGLLSAPFGPLLTAFPPPLAEVQDVCHGEAGHKCQHSHHDTRSLALVPEDERARKED